MMEVNTIFVVSADIARRLGVVESSYRTADGRFIVSQSALRMLRLTPMEYITGIDAEIVTLDRAKELIVEGGSKMGSETDEQVTVSENTEEATENAEEIAENAEESNTNEQATNEQTAEDQPEEEENTEAATVSDGDTKEEEE